MTSASAASTNQTKSSRFSCPCQHIPLSLSSATSAEYGDVASLARRMKAANQNNNIISSKTKNNANGGGLSSAIPGISDGGITPLHLAAQHGHPAAVSLLLTEGCCDGDTGLPIITGGRYSNDNGRSNNSEDDNNTTATKLCGATPLHRASFSGAVSSMQVLLSWRRPDKISRGVTNNSTGDHNYGGVNLLSRDVSFGDQRTPLHKAVAGGRPLAVQLLLTALRERELLRDGLLTRDAFGLTPLALAKQFTSLDEDELEQERCSVRRWDVVSGGTSADWNTCQRLLEGCMTDINVPMNNNNTATQINGSLPEMGCTDDENCVDGQCRTAAWENAFRMALVSSMKISLIATVGMNNNGSVNVTPTKTVSKESEEGSQTPNIKTSPSPSNTAAKAPIGRKCDACGSPSTVLFRGKNRQLVCKRCHRK